MILVTPTEISHSTDSTWTDVDVTSYVGDDAGSVAGVILQAVDNEGATENTWGLRKNGSTNNDTAVLEDSGHTWAAVGVDSNDIFELYLEDASEMDVYLVGYITNDEGTFLTNATDVDPGTLNAWTDIDITSDTLGDDVAKVAFFMIENWDSSGQDYGLRKNGSTDDRPIGIYSGDIRGAMMSVDSGEIVEGYMTDYSFDFHLMGYLTDNVYSFVNAADKSTGTTGSYQDVTFDDSITTEWYSPSATGDDYNDWTNPTNAYSSDDNYATAHSTSDDQDWYNFSLDIPSGSTISGITIDVECYNDSGSVTNGGIELSWDGGSSWTSDKTLQYPTSEQHKSVGGDLWGRASWTIDELSNANFRVHIWGGQATGTYYIDHVRAKVSYIPSDYDGAFWEFNGGTYSGGGEYAGAIRNKDDSTYDVYFDITKGQYGWVGIDASSTAEQKIEDTDLDLYLWGYTNTPSGGPSGPSGIKTLNDTAIADIKTINDTAIADVKTINDSS